MKQIHITDAAYEVVETVAKSYKISVPDALSRICLVYIECLFKKYCEMEGHHE